MVSRYTNHLRKSPMNPLFNAFITPTTARTSTKDLAGPAIAPGVRCLTNAEKQDIVGSYQVHKTQIKELSKIYGVSERTIGRVLEGAGLASPVPRIQGEAYQVMQLLKQYGITTAAELRPYLEETAPQTLAGTLAMIENAPIEDIYTILETVDTRRARYEIEQIQSAHDDEVEARANGMTPAELYRPGLTL